MHVKDQLHRALYFPTVPRRIVSLVPSQTELLVDLGLESQLVGITKFCVHPIHLRKAIRVVGGTKQIHLSKIQSLSPDIILCNKEENTKDIVTQCAAIAPVWVSDIASIEDNLKMIMQLGDIFQVEQKALAISNLIRLKLADFQKFMVNIPFKKVAYLIWKDPYMAAGNDTFIHELLQLNKFENIISKKRYPEVKLSELERAELILLSSEPYPFKEKDILEIQPKTNATIQCVDGEYFSWYGSRLLKAFPYFKTLHY